MTTKEKQVLKDWEKATLDLVSEFAKIYYESEKKVTAEDFVCAEIGDVFYIADEYWSLNSIIDAIRHKIPEKTLSDWYHYSLDYHSDIENKTELNKIHNLQGDVNYNLVNFHKFGGKCLS